MRSIVSNRKSIGNNIISNTARWNGGTASLTVDHDVSYNAISCIAVSFWMRTLKTGQCIVTKYSVAPYHGIACGVGIFTNKPVLSWKTYSTVWNEGTRMIADNEWHFVFCQHCSAGNKEYYIDGVIDLNITQTFDVNNSVNIKFNGIGAYQFQGNISDFRIYTDKYFSSNEILDIYHNHTLDTSCVLQLPFSTDLTTETFGNNAYNTTNVSLSSLVPPYGVARASSGTRKVVTGRKVV